jgi:lantibiotic leader peptide-processing serine protease
LAAQFGGPADGDWNGHGSWIGGNTLIVGSAGNAHVRIGADGRITSHGQLTTPGTTAEDFVDLFGWYRVPTGPPGALVVSATGNLVNRPSAACPPGTADNPNNTCEPASDAHQPFGVGKRNQLAYYSNYGRRVDVAAPGGARKFNLGAYDRGGTPGFPVTADDLTNVWQTFSTTSNWAFEIPCFTFTAGSGFPQGQCYSTIQGTSMAAPHAAAAVALIASEHPSLRHRPGALVARLKDKARSVRNDTPPLSATDTSPGDLTGVACPTGFCHLGGRPSPTATPSGPGWPTWPIREPQSASDWLWRTRSTMLSRARGEKGLVK